MRRHGVYRQPCALGLVGRRQSGPLLADDAAHPAPDLQWWGTEYRRRQRINYWLDLLRERIHQLHALDGRTRFVIADARFENEAHMIRAMGGVVWQITRDGIERVEGQHASATDGSLLNPSVVIDNDDTLHSLREAVLGEWLALETQIDVISLDLADRPARRRQGPAVQPGRSGGRRAQPGRRRPPGAHLWAAAMSARGPHHQPGARAPSAADLAPSALRPGATDALACPSRIGSLLYYRDGRTTNLMSRRPSCERTLHPKPDSLAASVVQPFSVNPDEERCHPGRHQRHVGRYHRTALWRRCRGPGGRAADAGFLRPAVQVRQPENDDRRAGGDGAPDEDATGGSMTNHTCALLEQVIAALTHEGHFPWSDKQYFVEALKAELAKPEQKKNPITLLTSSAPSPTAWQQNIPAPQRSREVKLCIR